MRKSRRLQPTLRCPECNAIVKKHGAIYVCPNHSKVSPNRYDPIQLSIARRKDLRLFKESATKTWDNFYKVFDGIVFSYHTWRHTKKEVEEVKERIRQSARVVRIKVRVIDSAKGTGYDVYVHDPRHIYPSVGDLK